MQLGFVAGGFLITRAALRFYYHVDKTLLLPIPFPARLVNEFGLLMLLVPGILYAAALLRRDKTSSVTSAEFLVGITVTVVVGLSFSLGALSAVLRPLISLYGGGPHVVN